jgi:hypothetical protein
MYVWSKALAVALVVTLWGYGPTALQAKDKKSQSCPKPQGCPAPVLQTPVVDSNCCPIPTVQTHCAAPVQTGCCGVIDNSKDISKAEKEAKHAYHEAVEACQKRQKAIAKAQHELEEKTAKEQARIDRANDHFNHEVSELQEANAKYESFFGGPTEATAAVIPEPEVQPAPYVAARPEPVPAPTAQVTQPEPTEEIAAVIETTPVPEPTPAPTPLKQLPRTAGEMSLIGLIGMLSLTGGYLTRFFRR